MLRRRSSYKTTARFASDRLQAWLFTEDTLIHEGFWHLTVLGVKVYLWKFYVIGFLYKGQKVIRQHDIQDAYYYAREGDSKWGKNSALAYRLNQLEPRREDRVPGGELEEQLCTLFEQRSIEILQSMFQTEQGVVWAYQTYQELRECVQNVFEQYMHFLGTDSVEHLEFHTFFINDEFTEVTVWYYDSRYPLDIASDVRFPAWYLYDLDWYKKEEQRRQEVLLMRQIEAEERGDHGVV